MLKRLREQLAARRARLTELLGINDRELSAAELTEFDTLAGDGAGSVRALAAQVASAESAERAENERLAAEQAAQAADSAERAARAAAASVEQGQAGTTERAGERPTGGAQVTDPLVYPRGGQRSYFRDMMSVGMNRPEHRDAAERLERSRRQSVDTIRQRAASGTDVMAQRALTTVDGAGGDFVPPVWILDEFVGLARAARTAADLVRQQPLPTGTDSINLPTFATGTAVAEQSTQNTPVQNTDATTASINAAVTTIAGQQVVAVQLLEQSPINMDDLLLADLAADYATKIDIFTLTNNVAGKRGILNVSGVSTGTVSATTITGAGSIYGQIAGAIAAVHTGRFLPPDTILMHPRRWAALLAAADSTGRPLIVPNAGPAMNGIGTQNGVVMQQQVGTIQGLPVFTDPNLPTNRGAGTNQDPVIIGRFSDLVLYEGVQRSEAFRETKADQLSVLLRFYNYAAFQGGRYPKSIAILDGVGLVPPTF